MRMKTAGTMARTSLSRKARRTQEQPISYLMAAALQQPGLISLAAGFVEVARTSKVRRVVRHYLQPAEPGPG